MNARESWRRPESNVPGNAETRGSPAARGTGAPRARDGVAMILVLAVLMALMVLAVPMLRIATHEDAASVGPLSRAEARATVESYLSYAKYQLQSGQKDEEKLAAGTQAATLTTSEGFVHATPDVDTENESQVPVDLLDNKGRPMTGNDGEPLMHRMNPRGTTADLKVRDEQAYPNLLSAPPFLIAASLARTTLSSDIKDTDTEIAGDDIAGFPEKNGALNIEGEVVFYKQKDHGRFTGCQRGASGGLRARPHRADAYILDDRAREIAMLPFKSPRAKGRFREPTMPTYVKEIALFGRDALSPLEVDRIAEEFSMLGRREVAGAFGEKTTVRAAIDNAQDDGNGFPIQVSSAEGFSAGTIVRISDGQKQEYGIVVRAQSPGGAFGGGFGRIILAEAPANSYDIGRTYVQPLLRHPVNINSAPRDVLYRLLEGIQFSLSGRGGGGGMMDGRVSGESVSIVVEGIISHRPIRDLKNFREVLEDLVTGNPLLFTSAQAETVMRNAVDPNDVLLLTSTLPFCFDSYDYYTIDASCVVNDQSGRELARHGVREFVHVSPNGKLAHVLETQADFERSLTRARGGKYVVTFPYSVERFSTATANPPSRISRMLYRFSGAFDLAKMTRGNAGAANADQGDDKDEEDGTFARGVFPSREEGHVTLAPARMEGTGLLKHFDGPTGGSLAIPDPGITLNKIDPLGWKLSSGPYKMDPREAGNRFGGGSMVVRAGGGQRGQFGGNGPGSGGAMVSVEVNVDGGPRGRGGPGGGGGGGGRTNSGGLMGRTTPNPVRFDAWYYTGTSPSGKHTVFDFVGDNPDESRVSLELNNGVLTGRVTDRTMRDPLEAFDEAAQAKWQPDVGGFWRPNTWYHLGLAYRGSKPDDVALFVDGFRRGKSRFLGTLAGNFGDTDSSFSIDDAEDWPTRGVAMVGAEVVAFERTGNSFDVVQFQAQNWGRGQRGTRRRSHLAGEPVTLYGYSGLPRTNTGSSGIAIPRGGGVLRDTLSHWCAATFAKNDTVTVSLPGPGGVPIPLQIEVHDPAKPQGGILSLQATSLGVPDFAGFPANGGYIVIVSQDVPVAGAPQGGIEFAKYQLRAGNQLLNVQGVPNPPNKVLSTIAAQYGSTLNFSLTRRIHPVRLAGQGSVQTINTLSCVFPVSIAVSDVEGYREPEAPKSGTGTSVNSGLTGAIAAALAAATWDTEPEFVQLGLPDTTKLENNLIEWVRYHHVDKSGGHLLCDEAKYILNAAVVARLGLGAQGGITSTYIANELPRVFPFRRQCGTAALTNGRISANCEVVPCFRTESPSERAAINNPNFNNGNLDAPVSGERWSFAGWGDSVTIEGQNAKDRKQAHVAWAGIDSVLPTVSFNVGGGTGSTALTFEVRPEYDGHGWVALTESLNQQYTQRALPRDGRTQARTNYVRLLKFPSGELPDMSRSARAFAGGDAEGRVGATDGYVDEVRVTPFEAHRYVLWNHEEMNFGGTTTAGGAAATPSKFGIDDTQDEIPVAGVEWLVSNPKSFGSEPKFYILPDGRKIDYDQDLADRSAAVAGEVLMQQNEAGIVLIDEEIVAYRGIGKTQGGAPALLDCQRGYMGSIPKRHGYGTNVVFLDFIAVSMLKDGMDATSANLTVARLDGFVQNGGTVLVDQEMIHYTEIQNGALSMPWALDEQGSQKGGLFRGRYGTLPRAHDANAIVLEMPIRFWDRYAPMQDSGEMAYYGFSLDYPGAYFDSLAMEKNRPSELVDVEVVCRTDPEIPWSADPKKTPGLFSFTDATKEQPAPIRRAGRGLDVRVYFKYLPGAFQPDLLTAQDWKSTPELDSMKVTYLDETRVLGREDLR